MKLLLTVVRSVGQVISLGDEGTAVAPALVQFADGDQDLAGGKPDRQVGTWLPAARVAGVDFRWSRPAQLGCGVDQSLEIPGGAGVSAPGRRARAFLERGDGRMQSAKLPGDP